MAYSTIVWGSSGSTAFAVQADLEAGTDNTLPASPALLNGYSYWLLNTSVTALFVDLMPFTG